MSINYSIHRSNHYNRSKAEEKKILLVVSDRVNAINKETDMTVYLIGTVY